MIIPNVIQAALTEFDEALVADLQALIPGNAETLAKMGDDEIKTIINDGDGGENNVKVLRCMRGCTALVALVGPERENLWIANLGDCQAGERPT
jgi:pyruvate dehydrogenase phosphatase